jgi:hypothetical protein
LFALLDRRFDPCTCNIKKYIEYEMGGNEEGTFLKTPDGFKDFCVCPGWKDVLPLYEVTVENKMETYDDGVTPPYVTYLLHPNEAERMETYLRGGQNKKIKV